MKRTTRLSFSPCVLALCALSAASLAQAERLALPSLDLPKLAAEDRTLDGKAGVPLRYGQVQDFGDKALGLPERGLQAGGTWTTAKDGRAQWWLQIDAAQARNLALHFDEFRLPAGAELKLYAAGEKTPSLVYTDADNTSRGDLRTPMLEGQSLRVELLVPQDKRAFTRLNLGSVVQGYRDPFVALAQVKSGSCNIDVACPQGDAWRPQIRSVAHYTFNSGGGSSFVCTGQLVATGSQAQDRSNPRFLTAHHCVSTAAEVQSMTLYWRYESPTCRAPGSTASGQQVPRDSNTAATQSGASLLATHRETDFTIVALNATVPAAADAWYTGWDRGTGVPTGTVGIHHPAGHEKRISIDNNAPSTGPSCIITNATQTTHWYVGAWDEGTTEGGSSGSGLWRRDTGRLIGVLSGGDASCATPGLSDCYGALDRGWTGGGTAATRMSDWMVRAGGSPLTQDGYGSCAAPTVSLSSAAFSSGARVGEQVAFSAAASGGSGFGYVFEWDLDGDGDFERRGSGNSVSLRYARAQSGQVSVRVADGLGCATVASRALDVQAARITATAQTPQQVCGNGNAGLDPGERWRIPVTLTNSGMAPLPAGAHALFVNAEGSGGAELYGPDAFGYRGTNSATDPGLCGYGFVDIGDAPALGLSAAGNFAAADDGRSSLITLGGSGFRLYGQTYTAAIMSTNGYVSFSANDSGGDYDNSCTGVMDNGGAGPRLHVLHDDLVVASNGGLRYRYFASCPRAPIGGSDQSCHVFQWDAMQVYSAASPTGNASFQAIAYPGNGQVVYQYRRANTNVGAGATIGLINASGADQLLASCNAENAAPAESAICVFDPQNLPLASAPVLLESPTVSVPALAVGASATVQLSVQVPQSSACGAPVGIDYLATALSGQHSMQPATVFAAQVAPSCAPVSTCPAATRPLPRRGFFSDPARGGNGLAVFTYGDNANPVVGAIWYTGDRSYLSDWYTLAGPLRGGLMESPLFRTRNNQPSGFAPVTTEIGRTWLATVDARTQLFAWDFGGGQRGAELLSSTAGTLPYASPDHTNAWIQTGQSGWGLAVEGLQLGDGPLEFFGVYLFDAAGQSRWLTGTSRSASSGSLELASQRTHCPGCPFYTDYASLATPAGTLTRSYSSRTRATMSSSVTLPAPLSGTWNRSNVEIQAFGDNNP